MAVNKLPTTIFANWSEDGTNITLPIASVPQLTAAEADAATGDSRKLIYALIHQIEKAFNEITLADRPTKLAITKSADVVISPTELARNYQFTFYITPSVYEVTDEPSA